MNEMNR